MIAWLLAIGLAVSITMTVLLLIATLWIYQETEDTSEED